MGTHQSLAVLIINLVLSLSRTAIGCLLIFMFIFKYKSTKKINTQTILILFSGIILIFTFILNPSLRNFISKMIIRKEYGTGRVQVWNLAIRTLKRSGLFLGMGYENSIKAFEMAGYGLKEFHSFYLETIVGGGLLDFLAYINIFIYNMKRVEFIKEFNNKVYSFYFASITTFMIYALFESISLFRIGYVGTIFTIYLFTLPLLYSNNQIYQINNIELEKK